MNTSKNPIENYIENFKEESKKITQKMEGKKRQKNKGKKKEVVAKRRFGAKHETIDEQYNEQDKKYEHCFNYSLEKHHFDLLQEHNYYKEKAFKETGEEDNFVKYTTKQLLFEHWPGETINQH